MEMVRKMVRWVLSKNRARAPECVYKCPEVFCWLCKDRAKSRRDLEACLGAYG